MLASVRSLISHCFAVVRGPGSSKFSFRSWLSLYSGPSRRLVLGILLLGPVQGKSILRVRKVVSMQCGATGDKAPSPDSVQGFGFAFWRVFSSI